jgi:hypothetical protein
MYSLHTRRLVFALIAASILCFGASAIYAHRAPSVRPSAESRWSGQVRVTLDKSQRRAIITVSAVGSNVPEALFLAEAMPGAPLRIESGIVQGNVAYRLGELSLPNGVLSTFGPHPIFQLARQDVRRLGEFGRTDLIHEVFRTGGMLVAVSFAGGGGAECASGGPGAPSCSTDCGGGLACQVSCPTGYACCGCTTCEFCSYPDAYCDCVPPTALD